MNFHTLPNTYKIISKVFEYCFIEKFSKFISTDNKQFGFKKGMGCSHAIYTVRHVVERFEGGNTVNLCAIDLSKAFDKVNHHACPTHETNEEKLTCIAKKTVKTRKLA